MEIHNTASIRFLKESDRGQNLAPLEKECTKVVDEFSSYI
jgi:hypothetical protein